MRFIYYLMTLRRLFFALAFGSSEGMMYSARLACGHASLVNLDNLHSANERILLEKSQKQEQERLRMLGRKAYEEEKKMKSKKQNVSRADVLHEAISKARPSASRRMRDAVLEIQEGEIELMECPVCLEATGEQDIAITPCAHKFCAECILSCLSTLSSSREPTGPCPECREKFAKSELTFLGDAEDAGKTASLTQDQKPKSSECKESNFDINGFQLSTKDTFAAASGAGDRRVVYQPLNDTEKRQQRAFCHTLPSEFLTAWDSGSNSIGTKIARLLEEIKLMKQKDPTAKAVVFSQFLGTLDVAQQELLARGFSVARVDGKTRWFVFSHIRVQLRSYNKFILPQTPTGMMKQHQRADAIYSFQNDPNTRVLLLSMRGEFSLGVSAVGLTLLTR